MKLKARFQSLCNPDVFLSIWDIRPFGVDPSIAFHTSIYQSSLEPISLNYCNITTGKNYTWTLRPVLKKGMKTLLKGRS